jgi:hypothetical protein
MSSSIASSSSPSRPSDTLSSSYFTAKVGLDASWNITLRWKQSKEQNETFKIFHSMRIDQQWQSNDRAHQWVQRSSDFNWRVDRTQYGHPRSHLGLLETCKSVEVKLERDLLSMNAGESCLVSFSLLRPFIFSHSCYNSPVRFPLRNLSEKRHHTDACELLHINTGPCTMLLPPLCRVLSSTMPKPIPLRKSRFGKALRTVESMQTCGNGVSTSL